MTRKVSPANLENAIRDYVAGDNSGVAAKRWGTSAKLLAVELKSRGLMRSYVEQRRMAAAKTWQTRADDMISVPIDELIHLRSLGMSEIELASRFNASRTTIRRRLDAAGIPMMGRERVRLPINDIIELYRSGMSENAIAERYSTSRPAIRNRLLKAGIAIRGQTDANRLMMSQRTPEEIARFTAPMHIAARGKKRTFEQLCNGAVGKEKTQAHATDSERLFAGWLADRSLSPVLQKAVGPYNIDVAVHPVGVEIYGGGWHAQGDHAARSRKRFEYILNNGWTAVVIWVNSRYCPLSIQAADYIVAFLEQVRSNPALIGQYRMIRGDGQDVTVDGTNLDYLTVIPSFARR